MFYQHCREGGLQATKEETDYMRDSWISTFKEMRDHMNLTPLPPTSAIGRLYGVTEEDPDDADPDQGRQLFRATCITGFVRNRASRNAAANVQFQSVVATGSKLAGWNLLYDLGMGDRLTAFIHDEYLYCLYPEELDEMVPKIESAMLEGMRTVIPDVKIGVETACSIHWDKGATEFSKLEKAPDGTYLIEEPEIVRQVEGEDAEGKDQQ